MVRVVRGSGLLCILLGFLLQACTPPVRQYGLKEQKLTCEQANSYSYRTLQGMGFTITAFEPAQMGRSGKIHGVRDERGSAQSVTVAITCNPGTTDIDASEDNRFLGQLDFKRAFYLAFTGMAVQTTVVEAAAREEAQRPLEQKRQKGLRVLMEPVAGLGAKVDFDLDLAAGQVLPVRVTINNATSRTYALDPGDIVLIQQDGTRVHTMPVDEAAQHVADAARQQTGNQAASPGASVIAQQLRKRLLNSSSILPNQLVEGYVFFPVGTYAKGRISLTDQESEEAEGFVVEF
ncbi:MAG: hypothetical protein ACHQ9S_26750 [Candidatus Binatia bacterium]